MTDWWSANLQGDGFILADSNLDERVGPDSGGGAALNTGYFRAHLGRGEHSGACHRVGGMAPEDIISAVDIAGEEG